MICIGKMDGPEVAFMPEPEFGITPMIWDVVVSKGLLRRKGETNFRTIGTVKDYRKELRKHFSFDQVKEWQK